MNNGSKPTYVEPDQQNLRTVLDEVPEEKLTARALEDIRSTERLSGVGRFAKKIENLFRTAKMSEAKQQMSHLKAAPIMMSAGLLLLLAMGLLFLLSKPESAVHSHFRQPTGLSSSDDYKGATVAKTSDTAVTESQLVGRDLDRDQPMTNPGKPEHGASGAGVSTRRFSFNNVDGGSTTSSGLPDQNGSNELQRPATVFVANTVNPGLPSPPRDRSQSDVQLPAGTEIIAHTTNAISSGLESPVIAIVDRNIQIGDSIVIPQGARVIGFTAGAIRNRVNVRFTSVILPSNRQITISGLALMKDGSAGLVGKAQGSGHPVLGTAARIGTGAAVVATEFAGQGSLNQPFSQGDYLRNQMAAEAASQGSQLSNRWQQPMSIPIVAVDANQPITIFLLEPLTIVGKASHSAVPASQLARATTTAGQTQPSELDLGA